MPILISIQKRFSDLIFEGFKRIEIRKFFPANFRGTMIVYECGDGSCHKVVGKFHTHGVAIYDPEKGVTPEVREAMKAAEATNQDWQNLTNLSERRYIIPVLDAVRITTRPLDEFSALYKTNPVLTPPRSWTLFRCEARRK